MTPETHHKGDTRWLTEQFEIIINIAGFNHASALAQKYSNAYKALHGYIEPKGKADTIARAECNKRLRAAIRRIKGEK